jgi:mannose-6-phosphate isomerase-like protein (cupin superfamily)
MVTIKRKISLNDVKVDEQLTEDEGWVNLRLRWIVTEDIGAKYGTFGYVEFPANSSHELHKHPNADEIFYVLSGRGIVRSGEEMFEVGPGDTVFVPQGDTHYFRNIDKKEPLIALFAYLGAPSLQKAGYELVES